MAIESGEARAARPAFTIERGEARVELMPPTAEH